MGCLRRNTLICKEESILDVKNICRRKAAFSSPSFFLSLVQLHTASFYYNIWRVYMHASTIIATSRARVYSVSGVKLSRSWFAHIAGKYGVLLPACKRA